MAKKKLEALKATAAVVASLVALLVVVLPTEGTGRWGWGVLVGDPALLV